MGKSLSIQRQEQNAEFQKCLEELQAILRERRKEPEEEFQRRIEERHRDSQAVPVGEWEKYDFRQVNEVTFSDLKRNVNDAADAVFPGPRQNPDLNPAVKESMQRLADFRSVAAAVSTNWLMEAMGFFQPDQNTGYWITLTEKSVAPGLTLHILARGLGCQDSRWFSGEYFMVSCVRCQLLFSQQDFLREQDTKFFNRQMEEIRSFEERLQRMQQRYIDLVIDPNAPEARLVEMERRISLAEEQLRYSRGEIEKALDAAIQNHISGPGGRR